MGATAPPGLLFDEPSHTYTFNGKQVPGVTTILKPAYDLSGIPPQVLARKAAIGKAAHRATELDDEGILDEDTVHPLVRPYLEAYRKWRREMAVEVLTSEQMVYHPRMSYAGTFDLTARLRGKAWLIDKKCTADISPVWAIQTAAYREAHPDRDSLTPAALHLSPDGSYTWLPYDKPAHAADFGVFAGLVSFHHWRTNKGV